MRVTLDWFEVRIGSEVGCTRQFDNMRDMLGHRYGFKGDAISTHIQAACAEMAAAKALGLYWCGSMASRSEVDIGRDVQVRHTEREAGCLIVHGSDDDDHAFVLVTGQIPEFEVVGWIRGRDAKRPEFVREPHPGRPAYFVPQSALIDIHHLSPVVMEPQADRVIDLTGAK